MKLKQVISSVKNQRAFSLLELLFVLSVSIILLSFSVVGLKKMWSTMERHLFFTQLQADIYYAQSYALGHQHSVMFRLIPYGTEYSATSMKTNKKILNRSIPPSITPVDTNMRVFEIKVNGNLSTFGTMTFKTDQGNVRVTFYIGRGRFHVQK